MYQKAPSTLEQAAHLGMKAKVITTAQETLRYAYISREDGVYYGVRKKSGRGDIMPLRAEEISGVYVKDPQLSSWSSVAMMAVSVIVLGSIIYGADVTAFGFNVK